jgi:hypothetical protein
MNPAANLYGPSGMPDFELEGSPELKPFPRFLEAASGIAHLLGLDAQKLLEGCPVQALGMTFRFVHYGVRDPDGMTILSQIGVVDKDDPSALRRLLEYNALLPGGRAGYYAIVPGTDTLVSCWRVDLTLPESTAERIVLDLCEMCEHVANVRTAVDDLMQQIFQ